MRLPLINVPVVYHLGTLDANRRGKHHKMSLEGSGISVSLCPQAWMSIAKLGGEPLKALCKSDALYLDLTELGIGDVAYIQRWATEQRLIETQEKWASFVCDEETDDWQYMLFPTKEAAIEQALLNADVDDGESPRQALEAFEKELETLPPGGKLVGRKTIQALTEKGNQRARGYGRDTDATDMAAMFWVEDVLRKTMPSVVGVWWRENFDPETLSAPRGAIFPSCLRHMSVEDANHVDDDEEMLSTMPATRLLQPSDLQSAYRYITNCVSSSADLISPMVDSQACKNLDFDDFSRELGGTIRQGRRILNGVFPEYQAGNMDIKKDWGVTYHSSQFDGMPCLFVIHSANEYVFQREGCINAPILGLHNFNGEETDDSKCNQTFGYRG